MVQSVVSWHQPMPTVNANSIELAYELHGDPAHPVLMLIHGLGMPLSAWPSRLIDLFVARGFRVLAFDNRDIGHSQLLDHLGFPNIKKAALRALLRLPVRAPYSLADMSEDARALLDALDIESAHVVGVSMGGMIAQELALAAPRRVRSLTSWMSTTGNRRLPGPKWAVARHLTSRPPTGAFADRLAFSLKTWKLIGSVAYPTDDEELIARVTRILERGAPPSGIARQMVAIFASPSRVPRLRTLDVPTLVIHGDADPLVPVACGYDTARVIPHANMHVVPGMGHDLPTVLLEPLADIITRHALSH